MLLGVKPRHIHGVVNKLYKIAWSYQTGLELYVLLLTPSTESSEAERGRERAFVQIDSGYSGAQVGVKGTRRSLEISFYLLLFSLWISNFE